MNNIKVWVKEDIRTLLETNDRAVLKGVVAIYKLQTEDEKAAATTSHENGVGFNGFDAEIMTSFAQQILKRGFLSIKQKTIARKKILKYAGQLTKIANQEI